jgi:prevent-host-death family protein
VAGEIPIGEAKTQLSRLIQRVERGEEIVIRRGPRPVAKLVPYAGPRREPGELRGQIWIADDFDELPDELLDAFEGK